MSWKYKITIFFCSFLVFMITMVYQCFQLDFDLVAEDYYAQELVFQKRIDQQKNALALSEKPTLEIVGNEFVVQFPNAIEQGSIRFFRPSDENLDVEEVLHLDANGAFNLPLSKLTKGNYQVQLSWNDAGKDFYIERKVFIP